MRTCAPIIDIWDEDEFENALHQLRHSSIVTAGMAFEHDGPKSTVIVGVYDLMDPAETLVEIHVPNAMKDKHVRRVIAEAAKVLGLISPDGGDPGAARNQGTS